MLSFIESIFGKKLKQLTPELIVALLSITILSTIANVSINFKNDIFYLIRNGILILGLFVITRIIIVLIFEILLGFLVNWLFLSHKVGTDILQRLENVSAIISTWYLAVYEPNFAEKLALLGLILIVILYVILPGIRPEKNLNETSLID